MEIREALPSHANCLASMVEEVLFLGNPFPFLRTKEESSALVDSWFQNQSVQPFVAVDDTKNVVGMVCASQYSRQSTMIWLSQLRVTESFRGRGLATALVQCVEGFADERGFSIVGLCAWQNGGLVSMYENFGYQCFVPTVWEIDFRDYRNDVGFKELIFMKKRI